MKSSDHKFHLALLSALLLSLSTGCHDEPEYTNTVNGNFDALWTLIDERYCYLDEKNIDWNAIGEKYRKEFKKEMTYDEFFNLCSRMLNELKDGHVNLSSQFDTSYYREWWSAYPQDFDLRVLQQYYLYFDYKQVGSLMYKKLDKDVGYIYYGSFASYVGDSLMDNILIWFKDCKVLIIDVRDNGGGQLTNIKPFVTRFIDSDFTAGYIRHKTGPGHSDFSDPYPIVYKPSKSVHWDKPVLVLCNRSTFSAANDFVCVMKQLPQTTVIGARSGGGGGMPFSAELPIGWSVRFSTSPVYDAEMNSIESGIDPTPGYEQHCSPPEFSMGHDAILDRALLESKKVI